MRMTTQLVFAISLACLNSGQASGQCSFDWKVGDQLPGVNGGVLAAMPWDPDGAGPEPEVLVVAGDFSAAQNIPANKIATWNGSAWQPLDNGIGEFGYVSALAVYNGELIAAGSHILGEKINPKSGLYEHVARWDGSSWQPFIPPVGSGGPDGTVFAMTVFNGELIVGGLFSSAAGVQANYIARWNGSTWQDLSGGVGSSVHDLEVFGGELIACGTFTTAGGVSANRIAKWNGSSWSAMGSGMNNSVTTLLSFSSELFAGGSFMIAGGISAKRIARWNGAAWQPLGAGMNDFVGELMAFDGAVIAGGAFTIAGNNAANRIAKWDGVGWIPLGEGVQDNDTSSSASVSALAQFAGELVVGGNFITAGDLGVAHLARWDGSDWHSFNAGSNGTVHAFLSFEDALIAGGSFTTIGGSNIRRLARWNGSSWSAFGTQDDQLNGAVYALAEYQNQLIVGGEFMMGDERQLSFIARWDGSGWQPLDLGTSGPVHTMTVHNGDLIVGGTFNMVGPLAVNNIARWDGAAWHAMGNGLSGFFDINGDFTTVLDLLVDEGTLTVGGDFTKSGTQTVKGIATWNGTSWQQVGPGLNNVVNAIAIYNGELIAGGKFIYPSGPEAIRRIARWDGSAWQRLGEGLESPANTSVNALAVFDGELIAGGGFESAGWNPATNIARWNGVEWNSLGQGLQACMGIRCTFWWPTVRAVMPFNGELFAGGQFLRAGETDSAFWARWAPSANCAADVAPACGDGEINVDDLLKIINAWGVCENPDDCASDIAPPESGNQQVDVDDLLMIVNSWGPC